MDTPTTTTDPTVLPLVALRDGSTRRLALPEGYTLERVGDDGWQTHTEGWTGPVRTHEAVRRSSRSPERLDAKAAAWAAGDACDRAWCA